MDSVIDQFMWGFQGHFRRDLAYRANDAFRSIGLAVAPEALLLGFAEREGLRHEICIEPENGPLEQSGFEAVIRRADEMYALDDDRHMLVTGEGQQERFEARSLDKSRRFAIQEALSKAEPSGERRYWVGPSEIVEAYRVFPVLSVLAGRWQIGPQLPHFEEGGFHLKQSFPEELMDKILGLAARSLVTGASPQSLVGVGDRPVEELVRAAARSFMDSIPLRLGAMPADIFDRLNELAATPYEGKPATGAMVFANDGDVESRSLDFGTAVSTSHVRQARKLLELSNSKRALVFDGGSICGLAEAVTAFTSEFRVDFYSRSVWTLSYRDEPVFRSTRGRATLPMPPLDRKLFIDNFERLFGGDADSDADTVWSLIETASDQGHGTMLVIHRDAVSEAARLGDQAVLIEPALLSSDALAAVTAIDGAIIVAPNGVCHAIGVILDGAVSGSGDPGRGARFNSAARYADQHRSDCLILVVSDDGSVEIVPGPRRRVSRLFIESVVREAEESAVSPIDFERSSRLLDRADAHAFYLSVDQCARLVAARELIEAARLKASGLSLLGWGIEPNSWCDDSYFVD